MTLSIAHVLWRSVLADCRDAGGDHIVRHLRRCSDTCPGIAFKAIAHLDEVVLLGAQQLKKSADMQARIVAAASKLLSHKLVDARPYAKRLLCAMRAITSLDMFEQAIASAKRKDLSAGKALDTVLSADFPVRPERLTRALAGLSDTVEYVRRLQAGEQQCMAAAAARRQTGPGKAVPKSNSTTSRAMLTATLTGVVLSWPAHVIP
jgi:hypothetical protein